MRVGFTAGKTLSDGKSHTLREIFSGVAPPGHIAYYVHVRNDPVLNSSGNAYVLAVGTEKDSSYPILWGEAKDFFYVEAGNFQVQFAAQTGNAKLFFDLEVTGCCPECPACQGGR